MSLTLMDKIQAAHELIRENVKKYPRHSFSFSGGKDSAVVLHLAKQALGDDVQLTIFAVLSDSEFPETEKCIADEKGVKIFRYTNPEDPHDCCRSEKVKKFKEAVSDIDCWFSGIRSDEGITRSDFKEVEEKDGLVKVNPILHFTETDVWRYLAINQVPLNPKYKEGYRSLSCAKCSAPEQCGDETERSGRWKGTDAEACECGIHTQSLRK